MKRKTGLFTHLISFLVGAMLVLPSISHPYAAAEDLICECPPVVEETIIVEDVGGDDSTLNEDPSQTETPAETTDEPVPDANEETVTPEETAPEAEPQAPATLVFSELLPDPIGLDTAGEFIEVKNIGSEANVGGWVIADSKGKSFTLPNVSVAAGGYYQFIYQETKITLVNSGGGLTLARPSGDIAESITYPASTSSGKSWSRHGSGSWEWTSLLTPGSENEFDPVVEATATVNENTAATQTTTTTATETEEIGGSDTPTNPQTMATSQLPLTQTEIAALHINEAMPDPESGDEWIELYNSSGSAIDLGGVIIDDIEGGSAPHTFADGTTIEPNAYLVVTKTQTKVALNNDGDSIRLIAADGQSIDSVTYDNAKKGLAWGKSEDSWSWLAPSPGLANPLPEFSAEVDVTTEEEMTELPNIEAINTSATLSEPGTETTAATSGEAILIVTLPPGITSKTVFAATTLEGVGFFVRIYGSPIPQLEVGDRLKLTMKDANGQNNWQKTTRARDMIRLGSGNIGSPEKLSVNDVYEDQNGKFVSVTGTVTGNGKGWLTLSDEELDSEVRVNMTVTDGFVWPNSGDMITVNGVVRWKNGQAEIFSGPESIETIASAENKESGVTLGEKKNETFESEKPSVGEKIEGVAIPFGGVMATAFAIWKAKKLSLFG